MKSLVKVAAGLAVACAPIAAYADDAPGRFSYAWKDPSLSSEYGVSAVVGGGVGGFTDKNMRDAVTTSVAGLWGLKVTVGSHIPIGLDLNYLGSAANINALIGSQSGTLVGTTAEGSLRYNILPHNDWNPYAFAGIGYQRYDITGATFRTSDTGMNDSDNSVVFPMGAGVSYRDRSGLVFDLRGTFRANANPGLVLENAGGTTFTPMHSWEASVGAGYEF